MATPAIAIKSSVSKPPRLRLRYLMRPTGRRPRFAPYLFLAPNVIIFALFVLFPVLYNIYLSLFNSADNTLENARYVGLQNYDQLLHHEDLFARAVSNTLIFVVGDVSMTILLSVGIALLLNRRLRFQAFFRSAFFYPVLLSPVVVALIWKWLLQTQYGALNAVLVAIGLHRVPWLLNSGWAMFWTIAITLWSSIGFYALILLAGLQAIPSVLYEAAAIDGAGNRTQFFRVTLPLLMPTLLVVFMLSVIRAFQSFDLIYVLTGGGPGTATLLLVQYIFHNAFDNMQFGLAAAASFLLAIVLLILTGAQLYLGRRYNETS